MATTRQPREKITTTTPSPTVRRTPRPSVPGSPDRDVHAKKQPVTEKHTPNYLKPTVRTSTTTPKPAAAAATTSTGTRVPARKSLEKPPSFQNHRPASREKPASRTSLAPSTRTASPRTSLDKSSRTKAPAASRSAVKKTRPSTAVVTDHYASDASSYKSETEEKLEFPILDHEVVDNANEILSIPPLNDHELLAEFNEPEPLLLKDPEVIFEAVKDDHVVTDIVDEHDEVEEHPTEGSNEVHEVVAAKTVEASSGVDVRAPFPEKKEGAKSNEVIEEFQSKMMEKRRNKVLALVGAFETVMHMQEPPKGGAAPEDGGVKESME